MCKRPLHIALELSIFVFQACAGCILSITKPNHVNVLCLSCLMLDQAPSHIISDPGVWLKLLGRTTLDPRFVSRYKTSCGANICTLRHFWKIHTGIEHIHWPWPCGANCWHSFDWWTDGRWKKRCVFRKMSFWFGRIQTGRIFHDISVLWTHFSVLSDAIRTALGKKKVRLKNKRPLHVCIVWANLPRNLCHQNWAMHPHVRNWVLRPTLMHAKMKEQSAPKNQSKEDRNRGIKHKREPMLWKCFLLHLQSSKIKMTAATIFKLANVVPQLQPTSMSDHHPTCKKQYLISKKVLSEKNMFFLKDN